MTKTTLFINFTKGAFFTVNTEDEKHSLTVAAIRNDMVVLIKRYDSLEEADANIQSILNTSKHPEDLMSLIIKEKYDIEVQADESIPEVTQEDADIIIGEMTNGMKNKLDHFMELLRTDPVLGNNVESVSKEMNKPKEKKSGFFSQFFGPKGEA